MVGASYDGLVQCPAARAQPEGLVAISPTASGRADLVLRPGGALRLGLFTGWAELLLADDLCLEATVEAYETWSAVGDPAAPQMLTLGPWDHMRAAPYADLGLLGSKIPPPIMASGGSWTSSRGCSACLAPSRRHR
jgi:hypothetical protein